MKEAEWLEGTDPRPLLRFLLRRASKRKLLLFAAACCWRIQRRLTAEGSCKAIRVLERFADGQVSLQEYVWGAEHRSSGSRPAGRAVARVIRTVRKSPVDREFETAWAATQWIPPAAALGARRRGTLPEVAEEAEREAQCQLLREMFGNPFQPAELDPPVLRWNEGAVPRLAEAIYNDRAFKKLPALGELLEKAGCSSEPIIKHCRQGESHALGCWVIDLALGKV